MKYGRHNPTQQLEISRQPTGKTRANASSAPTFSPRTATSTPPTASGGESISGVLRSCRWIVPILMLGLVVGCHDQAESTSETSTSSLTVRKVKRDHFALALNFLDERDEHNLARAARQTTYHLNRWIQDQAADAHWMIDRRLINTLPGILLRAPATKQILSDRALAKLEFNPSDVLFIEENRWLHALSQWVPNGPRNARLAKWTKQAKMSAKTARQLVVCQQLFDWTVRNIQLDPLLPYPKQVVAGPSNLVGSKNPMADWPPPMRAVPGPGYRHHPWHILMYGHGDMLERARVFMLLARQRHIDTVLLGIQTRTGRPKPWIPAVLLEKHLYLFDPELGLPIPGPDNQPIATLQQVVDAPDLLDPLSIGDKYKYRVTADELKKVVALIDASPEAMTQRMKILETHLDAAHAMVLTVTPTRIKRELEALHKVKKVRLWAVPLEATMYQQIHQAVAARNPEVEIQDFVDHGILTLGLNPLVMGRRQHLLGNFTGRGDVKGAIARYMEARTTNAQIEAMTVSEEARRAMGLVKPQDMPEHIWQQNIQKEKFMHVQAKQGASYWIGLIHFEQQHYDVAANWFKKRTLDAWPQGPWRYGARYNLARCKEKLGQAADARELYLIDDSPQRHGNLLRAQAIEKNLAKNKKSRPKTK